MDLELRHYRYFVALADELHFGRAAERVGISQPALSQQIRSIEEAVGTPLLTRRNRRLGLTEVGEVVYEEGLAVLRQAQHAHLATMQASRGEIGEISIGYVASAALSGALPRLIYDFRKDHPLVKVTMKESGLHDLVSAVDTGELHLAFLRLPLPSLPEGLALLDVTSEPVFVALHISHSLARRSSIDVSQLRDEPILCTHTEPGTGFFDTTLSICESAGFKPRVQPVASQMSTIITLVAAGLGVTFVPASMSNFSQPDVVFKPLSKSTIVSHLAAAFRRNRRSPALLSLLSRCSDLAAKRNGSDRRRVKA